MAWCEYGWFNRKRVGPRPSPCNCTPCVDQAHADEVYKNHKPGKWCKEHNQCSRCSQLKTLLRVVRHYAGNCSPKKCPVCEWGRHKPQSYRVRTYEDPVVFREQVIYKVYKLMFGKQPRWTLM